MYNLTTDIVLNHIKNDKDFINSLLVKKAMDFLLDFTVTNEVQFMNENLSINNSYDEDEDYDDEEELEEDFDEEFDEDDLEFDEEELEEEYYEEEFEIDEDDDEEEDPVPHRRGIKLMGFDGQEWENGFSKIVRSRARVYPSFWPRALDGSLNDK